MTTISSLVSALVAAIGFTSVPFHAAACVLSFASRATTPGGRIAALHIEVPNAAVVALAGLPPGWQVTIDNEPTWKAKISAKAIVGAAFIDAAASIPAIRLQPQPGHTCANLDATHAARVILTRYINDQLHDEPLPPAQIHVTTE